MYKILKLLTITIILVSGCDVAPTGSGGGGSVGTVDRELPSTDNDNYSPGSGYTLLWSDEFNDNAIDLNKWSYETKATGWSQSWNNELQDYTDNGTGGPNAFITNGILVIKAIKVNNNNTYDSYTSARMVTKGKKYWKYGKVVARIALPYGKGVWPAFWMLGNSG
ncbi:MAG: glycoside hydrolase family 16 protein, partial [Brevinematales bacterium]|nr:glycoside hydrolase family 16 protein [Brevinematales bacterium]